MIDYHVIDYVIGSNPFFSINEAELSIAIYIEKDNLTESTTGNGYNQSFFPRKIASFPLGENLFNFLSISYENLEKVRLAAESASTWNGFHAHDKTSVFLYSMDCIYLYLLFYSYSRGRLGLNYRSRLDRLSKEFEFALNFCCNDDFASEFKPLSSLQRYYLYSQLYIDNQYTVDRHYQKNVFLFMDTTSSMDTLNGISRMNMKTDRYGHIINEFEPITEKPTLPNDVIDALQKIQPSITFRYQCSSVEEYLMEELLALIKLNVRVKKCLGCGKYFILKGDYATDYCDRLPMGKKFTCKKLAATMNRKAKIQNNPILREYEKAYKRMYARLSNHKITNETFRLWTEAATQKRDLATEQYSVAPSDEIITEFKSYLGNK